ncbi:MAG: hypothetical protein V3S40_08750 [Kiloniellales bacterium]
MNHDDDFMKSIPLFLRRFEAPATMAPPVPPAAAPVSAPVSTPVSTGEAVPLAPVCTAADGQVPPAPTDEALTDEAMDEPVVPTGKPGTLPWMARRKARAAGGAPLGHVPVPPPLPVTSNGEAAPAESEEDHPQAKNFFRDTRVEIEQAFTLAPAKAHTPAPEGPGDDTDAPFQVTLPRGVIRQIRLRAAEVGTTHRAIVLRALRETGLAVPEGADVDRRVLAARQRRRA